MGFPGGSVGKKSICNAGESGSPGEGNGNPFQYSCLKNPMDRVAWWTTVREIAKSLDTTEHKSLLEATGPYLAAAVKNTLVFVILFIFHKWLTNDLYYVQVVVRELLAQYTKQYEERPVSSLLRNWAESGSDRLRTRCVIIQAASILDLESYSWAWLYRALYNSHLFKCKILI